MAMKCFLHWRLYVTLLDILQALILTERLQVPVRLLYNLYKCQGHVVIREWIENGIIRVLVKFFQFKYLNFSLTGSLVL